MTPGTGPWTPWSVLRCAVRLRRRFVALSALLFMSHQIGEALVPVVAGQAIDRALATADGAALLLWLAVLGIVFAGLSFSWQFGARASVRATEGAAHDIRLLIAARVLDPRGGADRGRLSGEVLSIATNDAMETSYVNAVLPRAAAVGAALLVAVVALVTVSVPLALLVIVGAPVLLIVLHFLSRPLERRAESEQAASAHAAGMASDLINGLRILKGIGAEDPAATRYRSASQRALTSTLRSARSEAMYGGVSILATGLFLALVALVAGRLAIEGRITVGELISSVGLAQFLLGPLTSAAYISAEFARVRASAGRVASILSTPPATQDTGRPLAGTVTGALRFDGVTTGAVTGFDLDVRPGEIVGIVTSRQEDAAGLIAVLARTADPDGGSILLEDTPIAEVGLTALRSTVVVARHHAQLFSGRLLDNVPQADAVRDTRALALRAAAADEVISRLPGGEDAVLVEGGRSLSGGQQQRVALARALATEAPILVLHDPTTAVDAMTESHIARGIRAMREGRTTLLFATSPALLATCDKVVFLHEGAVHASGTHADLLEHAPYRAVVTG